MNKSQQKIKITMIDISCKFYVQKNDVAYTNCINLVEAIIRHQKLQRFAYSSSFTPCENQRIINVWSGFRR